jgi:CBS domain-containing protein
MALEEQQPNGPFQEKMGRTIAQLVLWGTIGIALMGIVFAFMAMQPNADEYKVKAAFSILQYTFGALLPLWGTWIGTILAYYYSKQNFQAASDSVKQLVDKITSEKKLESVKAKDVMITKDKLITQTMLPAEDLSKFKVKEDCIDFVTTNKIKRVIILDDKDCAKYVVHRDNISFFISSETLAGRAVTDFTLKDMYEKGAQDIKDTMDNSVKFISEEANLLEAKNLMEKYKTCQDIFVTKTGDCKDPVLGWITNVTISQNCLV